MIENCTSDGGGPKSYDSEWDLTIQYDKDLVKLHDVVRDMALRITSVRPRFLVRAGMQLKEIPEVKDWNEDLEKAS